MLESDWQSSGLPAVFAAQLWWNANSRCCSFEYPRELHYVQKNI